MVEIKNIVYFASVVLIALLLGCLVPEEPAQPQVEVIEELRIQEVTFAVEELPAISCEPRLVLQELKTEIISPAAGLPLFALFGAANVTVVGNTTGTYGGVPVNITIIRVDNETVYAFNITDGNISIGVIKNNFTVLHPANLSAVDVLRANVTRAVNLTGAVQKTNSTCSPTATGPIIEFYNKTFPSIMGGRNLSRLIDDLTQSMNTSQNGTRVGGIIDGLSSYLNRTSKSGNFTIGVYMNITTVNVSLPINGTIVLIVNNSGNPATNYTYRYNQNVTIPYNFSIPDNNTVQIPANLNATISEPINVTIPANFTGTMNVTVDRLANATAAVTFLNISVNGVNVSVKNQNFNYTGIKEEFIDKEQLVLVNVIIDGTGHTMALDDLGTAPKANGRYDVSFMDPATGATYVTEMEPDGSFDYFGRKAVLISFVSLSPR